MTPLVLSRKDAALALNVSVWVLDRYIADRLLPTIQFPSTRHRDEKNRRVLISVEALRVFVDKHQERV